MATSFIFSAVSILNHILKEWTLFIRNSDCMTLLKVEDGRYVSIYHCMYKELYRELNTLSYSLDMATFYGGQDKLIIMQFFRVLNNDNIFNNTSP